MPYEFSHFCVQIQINILTQLQNQNETASLPAIINNQERNLIAVPNHWFLPKVIIYVREGTVIRAIIEVRTRIPVDMTGSTVGYDCTLL